MKSLRITRRLRALFAASVAGVLVFAGVALAADLQTSADLSTDVNVPTEVTIGSNPFEIYLSATGNAQAGHDRTVTVVHKYFMANDGTITPSSDAADRTSRTFDAQHYGDGSTTQACAANPKPLGCAPNPHVVPATLEVAAGTPGGTTGMLVVSQFNTGQLVADPSPATGHVIVVLSGYDFTGFFRPVDNLPVLNKAKAGSAIPVKFSLDGDQGLDVFESGFPKSEVIACDPAAEVDGIEQTVNAGGSSLSYDAVNDQYNYVWKTLKSWAGTCRQLVVKLDDGSVHRASFQFTK